VATIDEKDESDNKGNGESDDESDNEGDASGSEYKATCFAGLYSKVGGRVVSLTGY
jgi:hypothetical protein